MPLFLDDRCYENDQDDDDVNDNDDNDEESRFIRRVIYECFSGYNRFIEDVASWSAPHDWTVADVYMSVTKDIVDTVRYYIRGGARGGLGGLQPPRRRKLAPRRSETTNLSEQTLKQFFFFDLKK